MSHLKDKVVSLIYNNLGKVIPFHLENNLDEMSKKSQHTVIEVNQTYIIARWKQSDKRIDNQPVISLAAYVYLEGDSGTIASSAVTYDAHFVKVDGLLPWNDYQLCFTPVPLRGTGIYCHKEEMFRTPSGCM